MRIADLSQFDLLRRFRRGVSWRVGPYAIRVSTSLAFVVRHLTALYGEFSTLDDADIVDADVSVRPAGFWRSRVTIYADGQPLFHRIPRQQAVPLLEWTLNLSVFHRPSLHLLLHAAVVERGGRAAVLPGEAGSGKSTLCAALIQRGWRLLSDEVAVLQATDDRLLAVPRPVSLKEGAIEAIRRFAPDAPVQPPWPKTPKGRVAHVLPPAASVKRMDEPADPAWIIFPSFQPGAGASFESLPKADALIHCAANAFNYSVLGREGFERMVRLIDRCDCYELIYGDLEAAVEGFAQLGCPVGLREATRCGANR
ncbi:MAG: HprK-related kinase A [Planctomycetes bacterium]|nr:HprK-related kinase A [Planctomycetota bacterium]